MEYIRIIYLYIFVFVSYYVLILIFDFFYCYFKSQKNTIKLTDKLAVLIFVILFLIGIFYNPNLIIGSLCAGSVLAITHILCLFFISFAYFPPTLFKKKSQRIVDLYKSGFKIKKGSTVDHVYWHTVQRVSFDNEKFKLIINGKKKFIIDKNTHNFYWLLKNIPKGYKEIDYEFINSFFLDLTTCVVCGSIAFHNSRCLSCGCKSWSSELEKDYLNYEEYVKSNQLDIFSTLDKDEKFNNFKINDKNFDNDVNWEPLVTKKEVLDFSKELYWEKNE